MNIRDFEYLVALHRYGHFGQAAKACFVSQPTLSGQFKKLEKELGLSLLERTAKGVVFSEAGEAVVLKAKRVLDEVAQLQEAADFYKDPRGGRIKVGLIPTVGAYLLPHILEPLRKAFPHMRFQFHDLKTSEIVEGLDDGQIDLGILALPLSADGLKELPLYREAFHLALPRGHQHAQESSVDEAWFAKEHILLLEDGHCFSQQALEVCSRHGSRAASGFRATGLETLRAMVAMGEGITLVPELAVRSWEHEKSLAFLPFPKPQPEREVGLLFRRGSLRRELFVEMAELLKAALAKVLLQQRTSHQLIGLEPYQR